MELTDKKAAIELSISTIVVIVLAMTMLILGIVLVQKVLGGGIESVDILNDKVQSEITGLFSDEGADVIVKLGADQTAKIKPDGSNFGIAIGARTLDGSATNRERLKYTLKLEDATGKNCMSILGKPKTDEILITPIDKLLSFDTFQGANAFARVEVNVPKGTAICTQKVFIDVTDTKDNTNVGGNFFIIEVSKAGFF